MGSSSISYLEVMLEFEGLFAVGAFEFAEAGALVVTDHVALEAIDVGKILLAYYAGLSGFGKETHKKTRRRR